MKIILAALNAKYVHSNLAVYDLEAYTSEQLKKDADNSVELVIKEYTINHNLDLILQSLYQEKAAVVAFSCYIWNIHEILTIARELHKVAPEIHIWWGGPEVSYDSDKLLADHPFIEGIMRGEGEVTFYEMVKVWSRLEQQDSEKKESVSIEKDASRYISFDDGFEKNDMYKGVLGIVYRDAAGEIHENGRRPLMDLDEVPFVYTDLSRFENKILYYETSRGCPFSCSYCLSSIDKSVRFRSMELVRKELQFFLDEKVPQVKFIDRTFNCKREHALEIWNYITEHDNGVTNFHFEVAADLIGEEELVLFQKMRPGLIQLEIGLQSTNAVTIQEIRRVMNIEKLKKNMSVIRSYGNIHQHLDLIAGLPYEDFATFKKSFNEAYAMRPNQLQLGFLKVLKGSYMGEQIAEYGLKYQDFQPYEVLCTKWITYDEILALKKVEEMVEVYYNSDQFEHVLLYVVPFFETPYAFYEMLGRYYEAHQLFGIGFKREARYEALREFCLEWFGRSGDVTFSKAILDSLLTYDYYLRENAKSRPSWSKAEPVEKSLYQAFFRNGGTEEVSLLQDDYDSKVAARTMHIEPVVYEAVKWIVVAENENDDGVDVENTWFVGTKDEKEEDKKENKERSKKLIYCLFDYNSRNPLSKDAAVTILSHL